MYFPSCWPCLGNTDVSSSPFRVALMKRVTFSQSGLLTPALALLKDFLIFRTPHTSIDTASQLNIFLCPICFLPFIPQVLIPRVLSKKNLCMLNFISESASWRSQTGTKNLLEITTSLRGKCDRGCIWLQKPFKLPWVWVAELCKAKHRQSESKGSNCLFYMHSDLSTQVCFSCNFPQLRKW